MAAQANIKAVITAEDRASRVLRGFAGQVETMGSRVASAMKGAAMAFGAVAAASTVIGVKTAGELESAEQGFKTLLGSANAAGKIMDQIKKEAARTPFEIAGLTRATQLLSAVTKDGDRALKFILNIGEGLAAMGRGQEELDRISVNLQQIAATGRAYGIDIRQFAMAGIPIYEMLQKQIGLTGEALTEFIESGGVTFDTLEKMFADATAAGGRWEGAYKNQAGTFNQLMSNMKDSINVFMADLVKSVGIFDLVKQAMVAFTSNLTRSRDMLQHELIPQLKQWAANIQAVAMQIGEYLMPKLAALFDTIQNRLFPALERLWREVLQPLAPFIGGVLVGAVGLAVDWLNILYKTISFLMQVGLNFVQVWLGVKDQLVNLFRTIADVFGFMTQAILQKIDSLKGAFGSLPSPIKSVISDITNFIRDRFHDAIEFIKAAIREAKEAIESLKNSIGSLKSGAANTGQRILDPFKFFHNAKGTNYFPGGATVVGEQGPEVVNLPQGSRITPNHNLGGGMGGQVNFTVNVGVYSGNEMEKRKLAVELFNSFKDAAAARGMTATEMLGL